MSHSLYNLNKSLLVFHDVLSTLNSFVLVRPLNCSEQATVGNYATTAISQKKVSYNIPVLYVENGDKWDFRVSIHQGINSVVKDVHWVYTNELGEYKLQGTAQNGRTLVSNTIYEEKPLRDFYPKFKELLNGKIPSGFTFFMVSLATALSYEKIGIGVSYEEFLAKFLEVIATGDVHKLDDLVYIY